MYRTARAAKLDERLRRLEQRQRAGANPVLPPFHPGALRESLQALLALGYAKLHADPDYHIEEITKGTDTNVAS